jgi:GAF domain-containing protein
VTIAPDASPSPVTQLVPEVRPDPDTQLLTETLRAVAGLTGMQVAFVTAVDGPTLVWRQLHGRLDGLVAGTATALDDTFCGRMLTGAPTATADAGLDIAYAGTPLRQTLGVTAYVGVPLRRGGTVVGTIGAMDTRRVPVSVMQVRVLTALARVVAADAAAGPEVRLLRTGAGWEVESGDGMRQYETDLTVAMSLADLIAGAAAETVPPQRPQRPAEDLDEVERLKVQVRQLEHALSARIMIEQAIGVLAERYGVAPRDAFDRIRKSARSRGQRVHDLAVEIVRSARDGSVALPTDLR